MPYSMYPDGSPGSSFELLHVTGDTFGEEQEETVLNLLGRGRKVDRGTDYGRSGQLSCTLYPTDTRSVAAQMAEIEALRSPGCNAIRIDTPFGESIKASIVGLNGSRVSAGTDDYIELTIDYVEVA